MSFEVEVLKDFGIAAMAVYMMYKIATNHLQAIEKKLDKVIELLSK